MEKIKDETVQIRQDLDIISARMRVRDLARAVGFNTVDQARISLATSSLAYVLKMGDRRCGQITFGCPTDGKGRGVRVICVIQPNGEETEALEPRSSAFRDIRWMVDEINVEKLPSSDLQVCIVKRTGE
ncbi:MAG: hypothetical protein ACLFU8_09940 [Anaerolineales bacterium]